MFDNLFVAWGVTWTALTIGGLLLGAAAVLAAGLVAPPAIGGDTSRRHVR
jgi:hypothetical protein